MEPSSSEIGGGLGGFSGRIRRIDGSIEEYKRGFAPTSRLAQWAGAEGLGGRPRRRTEVFRGKSEKGPAAHFEELPESSEPVVRSPQGESREPLPGSQFNLSSSTPLPAGGGGLLRSDDQLEQAWMEVRDRLRAAIPESVFREWLEPLRPIGVKDGTLYLESSTEICDWVRRRFGPALSRALEEADSVYKRVELVTGAARMAVGPIPSQSAASHLKPAYAFTEFVIGVSNRFAHAAALAVAELPGQAYNPLFLYGPPGVGKTHLVQAIANYIVLNDRGLDVRYATVETFTSEFTNALRTNSIHDFKRSYRQVDVLLLDDAQFLESKPKTAEEFFFTFDALTGCGAQIVITADRPPAAMPLVEARLRERFQSGLVVDIQPPDLSTRLSIAQKRAGSEDDDKQEEALTYLARRVSSSVRALEGALIRSRAYASLTQQPLTIELIDHVLATLEDDDSELGSKRSAPTMERIQQTVSSALELPAADLSSPKRNRQVVYARQLAMYLCRELTSFSLPAIGERFGGRDHTTVLHAHRQIRSKIFSDQATRKLVDELVEDLKPIPSSMKK